MSKLILKENFMDDIEIPETGLIMKEWTPRKGLIEFKLIDNCSSKIGKTYYNNSGEPYVVLGVPNIKDSNGSHTYFLIEFKDKTRLVINTTNSRQGTVKNPNTPSIFYKGYIGQGIYSRRSHPKEYISWHGMIQRCYDTKFHKKYETYKDCTVDECWHNFQNFCEDIQHLEGYKEWKTCQVPRRYALDKDIKLKGNKIYSKDTCMFVSYKENSNNLNRDMSKVGLTGKKYLATNIKTHEEIPFENQTKFAMTYGLNSRTLSRRLSGKNLIYGDWSFTILD